MAGLQFHKNERGYTADMNNLAFSHKNAVRSNCKVVPHAPSDMGVRVQAGTVFFGQNVVPVLQQDVVIDPSDPSFDRIDLAVIDNTGTLLIIKGDVASDPHTPDYDPDDYVVLARMFIDDLATQIPSSKITDIRIINEGIGTFGKYVEAGITAQTSQIVTHNLNDTEPVVVCIDSSNQYVFPESITIDSDDQITVTFSPAFSGKIIVQGGAGGGGGGGTGGTLTVKEQDGSPTVLNVDEIRVSNGTLTDLGGGDIALDLTARVGTYVHNQSTPGTVWTVNHNFGEKLVQVQCFDASDVWIQPHSITLDSANQCTITFLSSQSGNAVIKK